MHQDANVRREAIQGRFSASGLLHRSVARIFPIRYPPLLIYTVRSVSPLFLYEIYS